MIMGNGGCVKALTDVVSSQSITLSFKRYAAASRREQNFGLGSLAKYCPGVFCMKMKM